MKIKYNDSHDDLWCVECKRRIEIGQKYAEVEEEYGFEKVKKHMHVECLPAEEEDLVIDDNEE